MTIRDANRTYLAIDIYRTWKRLVKRAESSITVYSPYFDHLVLSLLKHSAISKNRITIVTDLNHDSLLQLPRQLYAMRLALSQGMRLLTTPRLHAKVILVDDEYVVTGSQNVTSYARKSKECSTAPTDAMHGTRIVDTLLRWRNEATPIEASVVDLLISRLASSFKKHKLFVAETKTLFGHILEQCENEKRQSLTTRLEEIERQSKIKMASGVAFATLKLVKGEPHPFGDADEYYSLVADSKYNLTRWIIEDNEGAKHPYELRRLLIYPTIIAESNRMGFARIASTRITYIRDSVNFTQTFEIGDALLSVAIVFPKTETKRRNIVIKLRQRGSGSCEASYLFLGDSFELVARRYIRGKWTKSEDHEAFIRNLNMNLFHLESKVMDLITSALDRFKYKELGRDNKDVRSYLDGERFRLSVIQFMEKPIVVIKRT